MNAPLARIARRLAAAAAVAAVAAGLSLGSGCSRRSTPVDEGPTPPPGTGTVEIAFDGYWAVDAVVRTDGNPEPVPTVGGLGVPFLPLLDGQLLRFAAGRVVDGFGEPLFASWDPSTDNRRYLNSSDGRYWLFDFDFYRDQDCYSWVTVQAAFGTIDEDTLEGDVFVRDLTSCPRPLVVTPDPNGSYRVRMVRVQASPALLGR